MLGVNAVAGAVLGARNANPVLLEVAAAVDFAASLTVLAKIVSAAYMASMRGKGA